MNWVGSKKLALIPLHRSDADPPDLVPADWSNQILARVFLFPDPNTRLDMSLRAYIRAMSSGLADIDAVVMPMETVTSLHPAGFPETAALEAQLGPQLQSQGFDAAAWVMNNSHIVGSDSPFFSVVDMVEAPSVLGVWATTFITSLTGYFVQFGKSPQMAAYDEVVGSGGIHPSAYTKAHIGWLDSSAIAEPIGRAAVNYNLHSVGLVQPPPFGRSAAVRIGSQPPFLMVEARQRVDQFEAGIPGEGVIVYQVSAEGPNNGTLDLLTPTALTVGQGFTSDTGVTVKVVKALPGGFSVSVQDPNNAQVIVPDVVGELVSKAETRLLAAGLVPAIGKGPKTQYSWVFEQKPPAETIVPVKSTVTLTPKTGPIP